MATEAYVHGLGVCKVCGAPLMSVASGDTGGAVMSCITCDAKKPAMKPGIKLEDPGETEFKRVLAMAGVPIPDSSVKISQNTTKEVTKSRQVSIESIIADLESLPMPKSMKQFKAINKAISALKKALVEN